MGLSVSIVNAKQVVQDFEKMSQDLKTSVQVALLESGQLLQEEIQASIEGNRSEPRSVDTGDFLRSIETSAAPNGVVVSSDVPQSVFMEYGTSKIEERRHFRNSLERLRPIIKQKIVTATEEALA